MEKAKKPTIRSRHSYRERIRQVIQERIILGKPLTHRAILKDAGGGSASTVVSELTKIEHPKIAALVGLSALSLPQRIIALEEALQASLARERDLLAENRATKKLLDESRSEVDKLLASHEDAQQKLFQGIDDLRQLIKAGRSSNLPLVPSIENTNVLPRETGESIFWKSKHDQLLKRFIVLEAKNREMALQLHELGIDVI